MITGVDHVVIVVQQLEEASRDYAALGFTVTQGGTHADGKTHNALITFADGSYFELLAFLDREQSLDHPWRHRLDEDSGEGLEDFAVLSDDLEADVARIRAEGVRIGLEVGQPVSGGRRRPDGQELRWRTARFLQGRGAVALPFVIEDVTARALRVPGGAATEHRLPVAGVAGVTVAVRDLEASNRRFAALVGASGAVQEDGQRAHFALGKQWVELVTPASGRAGVAERIQRHGEGVFAVALRGGMDATEGERGERLDRARTHGAEIMVG